MTASSGVRLAASLRMDSPFSSIRWALCTRRSRMASARVGSPINSCQLDRQLAGDDGRAAVVAVVHDLQQVAPLLGGERGQAPVVEDQQLDPGQALQQAGVAPVAARQGERLEQPRQTLVEHRAVVAAGLVAEGAGQPGLADAGRAGEQQLLVAVDPIAGGQPLEQGAVEAARTARKSTSSTQAAWRRAANFSRATSRRFSRSVASRSTSRARRSSKPRPPCRAGGAARRAPWPCRRGRGRAGARGWVRPAGSLRLVPLARGRASDLLSGSSRRRGCSGAGRAGAGTGSAEGAVEAVPQDRGDRAVGRAPMQPAPAGGLQPPRRSPRKAQDAEAGAEALLRVRLGAQDRLHHAAAAGPTAAARHPGRGPVGVAPVGARHVLGHGGVVAQRRRTRMAATAPWWNTSTLRSVTRASTTSRASRLRHRCSPVGSAWFDGTDTNARAPRRGSRARPGSAAIRRTRRARPAAAAAPALDRREQRPAAGADPPHGAGVQRLQHLADGGVGLLSENKRRWRSRARIHRSTTCTPPRPWLCRAACAPAPAPRAP